MSKPLAIVAGEPNSVSSEIIFKSWKLRKKYKHRPFFVIGSIDLFKLQNKKLKYSIKINEINNNTLLNKLKNDALNIYNVNFNQQKPFQKISTKSNKYIINCFNLAIKLIKSRKIIGFINCPVSKETLFKNKSMGVTEFLSKKSGIKDSEAMLIYNKKLAVSPLTTHIPLKQVSNKIEKKLLIKKIKTINNFYKKFLKKVPKIGVLGLNPHNYSPNKMPEEKNIIIPAIKALKKIKIKLTGPLSPDTSFILNREAKFDVLVGMYHDQVLTPFKTLFDYNAINITLGLPYIRISPDHGIAKNIVGKKIANPKSLIEAIKFFNYIK